MLLALFLFVAGSFALYRLWLQASFTMALAIAGAWAALTLFAGLLAFPALRQRAVFGRLAASILIMAVVMEAGLRATSPRGEVSYLMWHPSYSATFRPAAGALPGISYAESRFTASREGLRARERRADDELRILAVGGSTTECLYVDDADVWTSLLETSLSTRIASRVWVGNAGKAGLRLVHHTVLMRTLATEIRPDVTIVLVGANDITETASALDWDRGMLQYQMVRSGPLLVDGRPRYSGLRLFWEAKRIGQLVKYTGPTAEVLVQDDAGLGTVEQRQRRQAGAHIATPPADLPELLSAYNARLRELVASARAIGTRLVLMTQPSLYKTAMPAAEEALLWGGRLTPSSDSYYTSEVMVGLVGAYNAETLKVCSAEGLDCLDLAAKIGTGLERFYDDYHFNVAGSRRVAAHVTDFLMERGILKAR